MAIERISFPEGLDLGCDFDIDRNISKIISANRSKALILGQGFYDITPKILLPTEHRFSLYVDGSKARLLRHENQKTTAYVDKNCQVLNNDAVDSYELVDQSAVINIKANVGESLKLFEVIRYIPDIRIYIASLSKKNY